MWLTLCCWGSRKMRVPKRQGKGLARRHTSCQAPPPASLATVDGSRPPWAAWLPGWGLGAEHELPFQLRRTVRGSGRRIYRATVYYLEGRRLAPKAGIVLKGAGWSIFVIATTHQ